jgi:aspartyl-tRNA(Asn)/glutamyl-tRNA(Gln) amidotransferase subunit A
MDASYDSLTASAEAIRTGATTATELVRASLDRIDQVEEQLHCCTQVFNERAMAVAAGIDQGERSGPLRGVPIVIKDNMCTSFGRTTCSSRMLEHFEAPYDATAVQRLEAAGAVIIAKSNLDEFAMGSSTEHSAFGATRNPWDTDRVPGGSSGGSAAAVAAGYALAAVGSDTGGSIRQPAAFCGVVGFKPTYGRISRYGLVAFASSLDQIGPLTRNVTDAALLTEVMGGFDPMDSTSSQKSFTGLCDDIDRPIEGLRIGLASQYLSDDNDPAVAQAIDEAVKLYRDAGATIVEVDLPHTEYGIPIYYIVAPAEASSNLARYDGVHYGHRTEDPENLVDLYAASRSEGFGSEVQQRIMLGTYALSSGYYDAYYLRALKVRRLIKNDFDTAFESCDVILCPTTPTPAFRFAEKSDDPLKMYLNDIYTVNANLAGLPAISVPAGTVEVGDKNLPLGVQLIGPAFEDARVLRAGRMYEVLRGEVAATAPI